MATTMFADVSDLGIRSFQSALDYVLAHTGHPCVSPPWNVSTVSWSAYLADLAETRDELSHELRAREYGREMRSRITERTANARGKRR